MPAGGAAGGHLLLDGHRLGLRTPLAAASAWPPWWTAASPSGARAFAGLALPAPPRARACDGARPDRSCSPAGLDAAPSRKGVLASACRGSLRADEAVVVGPVVGLASSMRLEAERPPRPRPRAGAACRRPGVRAEGASAVRPPRPRPRPRGSAARSGGRAAIASSAVRASGRRLGRCRAPSRFRRVELWGRRAWPAPRLRPPRCVNGRLPVVRPRRYRPRGEARAGLGFSAIVSVDARSTAGLGSPAARSGARAWARPARSGGSAIGGWRCDLFGLGRPWGWGRRA